MQPAQPQYGVQPPNQYGAPQPQYGAPQPQYGAPQPQYGAPPQNQYAPPVQQQQQYAPQPVVTQPNPYANNPADTTAEDDDDAGGKEIYDDEQAKGDPWKFVPEWDDAAELKGKTACCCCNCAFDDCEDVMQLQCQTVFLCLDSAISWRLFQCQDPKQRACCLNTSKVAMCDFTSEDDDVLCSLLNCGIQGVFCLCCSGKAYEAVCDPCMMPDTCAKQLCQFLCIHQRCALPCDDDVPFEIGCCGFMCKEAE